ncbi:MAG: DUF58 domain-containing protein [Armatimonadetes bacterium]|nr:DUF58 domain-containing protein [Armatimonadota bacterium]
MRQDTVYRRTGTLSSIRSNRAVAGTALGAAALFMAIVAVLLNSTALFFMGTALIATIGAARLQALLSVRGLRFERVAPPSIRLGDEVTIEITVWSEKAIRRPLISVYDALPPKLVITDRSPSLPIAPAFDIPIRSQYSFRPLRRGRFKWSGIVAEGSDALGLVTMQREYPTAVTTLTVLPRPIPVNLELPASLGYGINEASSGKARGAGLEPRGVREYSRSDSLRHVHWRSSARARQLLVKEFETGSSTAAAFMIQSTLGTEIGADGSTTLELMIGHATYLADIFLSQGAHVVFPGLESKPRFASHAERMEEIYELLTDVQANRKETLGQDAAESTGDLPHGSTVYCLLSVADRDLISAAVALRGQGVNVVALLYDASKFAKKNSRPFESATSPEFVTEITRSGVLPIVVPLEVNS